jgi:hypothetical protein
MLLWQEFRIKIIMLNIFLLLLIITCPFLLLFVGKYLSFCATIHINNVFAQQDINYVKRKDIINIAYNWQPYINLLNINNIIRVLKATPKNLSYREVDFISKLCYNQQNYDMFFGLLEAYAPDRIFQFSESCDPKFIDLVGVFNVLLRNKKHCTNCDRDYNDFIKKHKNNKGLIKLICILD